MGDIMRPVPFAELMNRITTEYANQKSIFGIQEEQFYKDKEKHSITVFGQPCSTPCGPAAGPHTQLAQNIVSSYLVGGRFIELKTVQKMDTLEIDKPCIDARDEGYNVEWSTEYTLPKAWDEYVKAWIILHVIEACMRGGKISQPSFIFNMSVGYDLDGIKTPKMQAYINDMMDASKNPKFAEYLMELDALLESGELFSGTPWQGMEKKIKGITNHISPFISSSVTISTMHGCPPHEIEAICTYMISEKKLDTFVKLNPTLLGYDAVRNILDVLGYDYIGLKRESFEHDLQYPDAIAMLHRLVDLAASEKKGFGVKLTNTLGSVNDQNQLPGDEMYMSGRALLPLSTNVAALLSKEFDGKLPISYSGGATAFTIKSLFDTGIRPITVATDMLKPGGYSRLKQMVEILEKESKAWDMKQVNVEKIEAFALAARNNEVLQKDFRGTDRATVQEVLPLFDCYIAPCVQACPIGQDIPEYVHLVGNGQYAEALALIYDKNPLPGITGTICDHQCQYHCTRLDYEGSVQIREMKKIAWEEGFKDYIKEWEPLDPPADVKAAVIGAGPAGLSAAYFLARAGFSVTVFEREETAGGVVRNVIPGFRIPQETIEADVDFIKAHGVDFRFGVGLSQVTAENLKKDGFTYIFYAVGSEKDNDLSLQGDRSRLKHALEFLRELREGTIQKLGKDVVIIGGGNTAMDSARAAKRVPGVEHVSVIYRRTEKEMPADREEYELAKEEGIEFIFLANPVAYDANGSLSCMKMKLGELDASGRKSPIETGELFTLHADSMIAAISEHPDAKALNVFGIPVTEKGWPQVNNETLETMVSGVYAIGDVQSGPSTVVRCIASARKAVEAAIDDVLGEETLDDEHHHEHEEGCSCGCHDHDEDDEEEDLDELERAENEFFAEVRAKKSNLLWSSSAREKRKEFAKTEAARCVECSYLCNKCVEVCPNRANVAIDVRNYGIFDDPFQILHLDAFCNECGNCGTFCPWQGNPYLDKLTLFSRKDDFEASKNQGFYVEGNEVTLRIHESVMKAEIDGEGTLVGEGFSEEIASVIEEVFSSYAYLLGAVGE